MPNVVDEFRETVDRWFELPIKGIPKSATLVGAGAYSHRSFGGFEAHRYKEGDTVRFNGAPRMPLIGVGVPVSRFIDLLVYSRYDDDEQLYRQVRVQHDYMEDTGVSKMLDKEGSDMALLIAKNPLIHTAEIEALCATTSIEMQAIYEDALSVSALHVRIRTGLQAIDEAYRQRLPDAVF